MVSNSTRAAAVPVLPAERYEIIDIIRGFALFGVLYINLLWTARYIARDSAPKDQFIVGPFDNLSFLFSELFFNHKFYALFSLLFGLGFALQLASARNRGASGIATYLRRLTILFLIGLLHALLLWPEDVLHVYALLGFGLVLFRNCSDRSLLGWSGMFLAATVLVTVLQWAVFNAESTAPEPAEAEIAQQASAGLDEPGAFQLMTSANYADVLQFNRGEIQRKYSSGDIGPGSVVHWYLTIFWKFLLGMYLGRKGLLQRAEQHRGLFASALRWTSALALTGMVVIALMFGPLEAIVFDSPLLLALCWVAVEAGMMALAGVYLCAIVIWFRRASGRRALAPLAPLGRMALTNYLAHSIVFLFLFYGIGFGLLGRVTHAGVLPIAVTIFVAQILLSGWWLSRFRFGPAEWLWRSLTYGVLQPIR